MWKMRFEQFATDGKSAVSQGISNYRLRYYQVSDCKTQELQNVILFGEGRILFLRCFDY
jgi:hypothetical protein